jgi:hypothetical protein
MTMVIEMERPSETGNEQLEAWREIGQRLQDLRTRLDEPFAVEAARAEIKPTDLAAIERGEGVLSEKDFQLLLSALKVSPVDFLSDLSSPARLLIMEIFKPDPTSPSSGARDAVLPMQNNVESLSSRDGADGAQATSHARIQPERSRNGWGIAREPRQITYYQMHACLRGLFKRTDREKAEIIYSWTSPADIDIKVFTSVDARTGLARPVGEDAIRIVVYDKRAKRKIVSWSIELKRTTGWHTRLQEKTGAAILRASYRPRCPVCRQDTIIIYGRPDAQFWGCSDYPACDGALDLQREERADIQSNAKADFSLKGSPGKVLNTERM